MNNEDKKDIFEKIVKKAQNVSLSEQEKAALLRNIEIYVEQHPVKQPKISIQRYDTFQSWTAVFARPVSFALIVFLIIGTGTSYAASKSLPGNILYSVKVGINEKITELFLSQAGKAKFEAGLINKRINEAQILIEQDKFTEKAQTQLTEQFNKHIYNISSDLQTLRQNGELNVSLDISNNLELALQEKEEEFNKSGEKKDLEKIVEYARLARQSVSSSRLETEDVISETSSNENSEAQIIAETKLSSALKLIDSVEKKTKNVLELPDTDFVLTEIKPVSSGISIETSAPVPIQTENKKINGKNKTSRTDALSQAHEFLTLGQNLIKQKKYHEAFLNFKKAYDIADNLNDETEQESELINIESSIDEINANLEQ